MSCPTNKEECYLMNWLKSDEKFKIVAKGRKDGAVIQDGDIVGIFYGNGKWLSCDCNDYCNTQTCPGEPRISEHLEMKAPAFFATFK